MFEHWKKNSLSLVFLSLFTVTAFGQKTLILEPSLDNTLYETVIDVGDELNELSNGVGSYIFAGRTSVNAGFKLRRAVLKFDLQGKLPENSELVSAELTVYQSMAAPGAPPATMTLHRVLQSWGEGASDPLGAEGQGFPAQPGDATWHHSVFPDQLWSTAGGQFSPTASAGDIIGTRQQYYSWSSTDALLVDLNHWLDNPGQNFGWIIVGGEAGGQSARRFSSRHHEDAEKRPELTLVYQEKDNIFEDSFE